MRRNPAQVRYRDLLRVCRYYFGEARMSASSHAVFRTPWTGDPRVNIQSAREMAKAYQVREVLAAIERLECEGHGAP